MIPAHNAGRFVAATIESVLRQTVPPSDVVVVDDGSSDETASIARASGARVIAHTESRGPSASRNRGVAETSHPVVAFLDADDEWMPDHAERLLDALTEDDVVFAGSDAQRFGTDSGEIRSQLPGRRPIDLSDNLIMDNPVIQSSVMVVREAFVKAGGYDESLRLSEDYELWTRIAEYGLYAHVGEATVRRRIHAEQVTQRFRGDLVRAWWGVRRRVLERRLRNANPAKRDHLLSLLDAACQADLDWAIWTGDGAMLALVREELRATDTELALSDRLTAASGLRSPSRRLSQDVRCASRSLLQMVRGNR